MLSPLESLIACGTRLWLDSVDPDFVAANARLGATGATSNPIIIGDLVGSGRYDRELRDMLVQGGLSSEEAAWQLTDRIVAAAQEVFLPAWESSGGNDGYVSFELDPLLEDPAKNYPHQEKVERYIELGQKWSAGHRNRMIKVPATPAGLASLEPLAALGVPLNVTLIFTLRQYRTTRDAIWRGAQRLDSLARFKSVYSIFISRVDVYTAKHVPQLSQQAQGQAGIVYAKQMWADNQAAWSSRPTPLQQEIVFASTGTKLAEDPPWKYVEALAGSDIQTNPPATNEAVEQSGRTFQRTVDQFPPQEVLDEIEARVDLGQLEEVLMREGVKKFASPQFALLDLIESRREALETNRGAS